jgi:nicotinamidase-related amidase
MTSMTSDPAATGLVLVDPYNDVLSEGRKMWPRTRDVVESTGTVEHLRELLTGFRAAGLPVFVAPHRRWRPGDTSRWQRAARTHRGLADRGRRALGMNGFAGTDLDLQLRQHGVQHVVLAGMTASGCVEGTGRYALELGYSVTLVRDATAAFRPELLHAVTDLTGPFWAETIRQAADGIAALPASNLTD